MQNRIDLASPIHKAIRKILFDTAFELGRTDFSDPNECRAAIDRVGRSILLLREHGDHEDQVIFPVIAAFAPALATEAAQQHARIESGFRDLERLSAVLMVGTSAELPVLGKRLQDRWYRFVAEQLVHLSFEERELNAVLWEHVADSELLAMRGRIQARIPPSSAPRWRELIPACLDKVELSALLASAPAHAREDAVG